MRVSSNGVPFYSLSPEEAQSTEAYALCRICLETDFTESTISPCRCSGSLKYIHEDCLKTWLATKHKDLHNVKCEICHTGFLMSFSVRTKCSMNMTLDERLNQFLFMPLLLSMLSMLIFIVYIIVEKLMTAPGENEEVAYGVVLAVSCSISISIIIVIIVRTIKEACFVSELSEWKIFDQEFDVEQEVHVEYVELNVNQDELVFPEFVRLKGKRLRTITMRKIARRQTVGGFKTFATSSNTSREPPARRQTYNERVTVYSPIEFQ